MRTYVPFEGRWSMRIDVPYSLLLRDGDDAWSSGQAPLDTNAEVVAPGDLAAQTRISCGHIANILSDGGFGREALGKLVLYHTARNASDTDSMLDIARETFGPQPLLVPVAVPHFFYEGMVIEVDAFATARRGATLDYSDNDGRVKVRLVNGGSFVWAALELQAEPSAEDLELANTQLEKALRVLSLSPRHKLSEHWFAPGSSYEVPSGVPAGMVVTSEPVVPAVLGELTFIKAGPVHEERHTQAGSVQIVTRKSGAHLWLAGWCTDENAGLVEQTERIVDALADALARNGAAFSDVAKSTTHYVGGASEENLHDNMAVRNARYEKPGPASTGIAVSGLNAKGARIAIDLCVVTPD